VVNRLNADLNRALATPEVNDRMAMLQAEVSASTPEQLASLVRAEQQRWSRIITERGIKLD
jgi:tripartite-type tricarboxylate transporter receptor subunit TctC